MVSKMNYDDLLSHIGTFSWYQLRNFILLCIPVILCAFHKLSSVFILAKMNHRCQLYANDTNFLLSSDANDLERIKNVSFPYDEKKNYSSCQFYSHNYFNMNGTGDNSTLACSEYVWDTEKFQSSAIKSFQLVCERESFKAMSDSLFMIGVFIGSFAFGHLSDKYGRRIVFVLSLLFQLIFGFLTALSPNFLLFTIFRMIVGATTSGVFLVAYCLSLEMVGKEMRMTAGVLFMCFFSTGYILMGFIAFLITDWRWYQIAITMPGLIFLTYWWFIPESTRWLLANNKNEQAVKQIKKIASSNNVELPKEMLDKLVESESENNGDDDKGSKPSVLDLFKLPHLRTKALLIFFNWLIVSGAYYGLSWSSGDLVGNPRWNHIISGFVEFPGYVLLLLTLDRFGRKKVLAGNLTFAGVVLLLSLAVPQEKTWLVLTLTMLGKMSITASYGTIYLFSVEQFPTVIRNVALGCCSMSARIGSSTAPFLLLLGNNVAILIFGLTTFVAGFFCLLLPETFKKDLPDTLADAEKNDNVKVCEVGEELKVLNKNDNKETNPDT